MSAPPSSRGEPISDRRQLIEYLEAGCKPAESWRIGTEHEKFVFCGPSHAPVPYASFGGICDILGEFQYRFGWEPVYEGDNLIALTKGLASISLEPGGQFELSGAPLATVHLTWSELREHLAQARAIGEDLGFRMLGMGFNPKWKRSEIPLMPKGRYKIMGDYMPKVGTLGLDMMTRTCTVQVNLDFSSEADMVKKFRVSLALQPIATALFASSPFTEGRPNGFQSYRSHIWTDTDKDRTGDLPFVFEEGFGFERYVDYALDVPMYFVHRHGRYVDASGLSFRDFMDGKLGVIPGEKPLVTDWTDHLTTMFPEVRLKKYLEMRGADAGPEDMLCALPAFWVGLLYDRGALDAAWDIVKEWTQLDRAMLRRDVPRMGLYAPFRGQTVLDVARRVVEVAFEGLKSRGRALGMDDDETKFIVPLTEIAKTGRTLSTDMLEKYYRDWGCDVGAVYQTYAY